MDKTVPKGAAYLLDFIGKIEAPQGYDTVYGNNQRKLKKPVTKMTLGEIQSAQGSWTKQFGSSATGRYQFMKATLKELILELGLDMNQKLDADLQDRLAYHLLRRRGYDAFMFGKIDGTEFGKRLAQEWASLPVLAGTQGQKLRVKRGQSYYAGDGLNKSLVKPGDVEIALAKAKDIHKNAPAAPRVKKIGPAIVVAGGAGAVAGGAGVATAPDDPVKGITEAAEAIKPVGEALGTLTGVPLSAILIGICVAALVGAVYWYITRKNKDDVDTQPNAEDEVVLIDSSVITDRPIDRRPEDQG